MAATCIPHIIHQTSRTSKIPEAWQWCVDTVKEHHAGWDYHLWTNESAKQFVAKHFPDLSKTFNALTLDIQRADAIRYLVLYHFGGLYLDTDFECLRPFDELIADHTFVITSEPAVHSKNFYQLDLMVTNGFMASIPKHPFMGEVIAQVARVKPDIDAHSNVLQTTGPLMVDRVWKQRPRDDVHVLAEHVVLPCAGSADLMTMRTKSQGHDTIRRKLIDTGSYAVHYWANSYLKAQDDSLNNPRPHDVKGYRFYPGRDSASYDIGIVGRDVQVLARECDLNPS